MISEGFRAPSRVLSEDTCHNPHRGKILTTTDATLLPHLSKMQMGSGEAELIGRSFVFIFGASYR